MLKYVTILLAALSATVYADGVISGSVDAKPAKFLKDTIVFVKAIPSAKLAPKTVEIDQKGMEFDPHVVLIGVGDTVKFHNHDKVDHNVTSPSGGYDLGAWGTGGIKEHVFKAEGVFEQTCKLHPEMLAYVFVGQNRAAAQVDDKGNFTITGVPAGTYELEVWNPKLKGAGQKVVVTDGGKTDARFSIAR